MTPRLAWITGAGGFLGSHLVAAAARFAPGWRIEPLTRERLDLTDLPAVTRAFAAHKPSCILHAAGMTRAAACQADPARARLLNVSVTRHLCGLAEDIPLLFLSTDLVFDGRQGDYIEMDPVNPLSVYAESKVQAEGGVLSNPRHTVVRLALNTGSSPTGNRSFVEEMRAAWDRGETLTLFTDEYRCPLAAEVTARAIWELVEQDRPGLYHLGGSERLSRWEIGRLLTARWPAGRGRISAGSLKEYRGPPRPPDTSLNSAKIQALLSFQLPGLTAWLETHPEATL